MIKIIFVLALTTIMAGTIFTGCHRPASKKEVALAKLQDADKGLKEAQANADARKTAAAEEWRTFKNESELKIMNNDIRIAELRIKLNKPGKTFDKHNAKRIAALEQQNRDMKSRIEVYDKNQTDWETFSREFNRDMDDLAQALKDIMVDNKK